MHTCKSLLGLGSLLAALATATPVSSPQAVAAAAAPDASIASKPIYLFNFGDSYSASGFKVSGTQPHPGDPMGNPPPRQDDFAGGPDWAAWLTTRYNKTLVLDYDLAFGGATINDSIVPAKNATIRTFQNQVQKEFIPVYGGSDHLWSSDNTIFTIFLGINDVGHSYDEGNEFASKLPALIDSYFKLCSELYSHGARKFMFINVPPVQRSNATLRHDTPAENALRGKDTQRFNSALQSRVPTWARGLQGVQYSVYDYYAYMNKVLDNPTTYGFHDATCAGSGQSNCVWWAPNALHTTSHFQRGVAQDMVASLQPLGW